MPHSLSDKAEEAISLGSVKIRVIRSGIYQQLTFTLKRVRLGDIEYVELFTNRIVDISELSRISDETGLPVEAQNGKAFPKGTSAADFQYPNSASPS